MAALIELTDDGIAFCCTPLPGESGFCDWRGPQQVIDRRTQPVSPLADTATNVTVALGSLGDDERTDKTKKDSQKGKHHVR